MDGGRFFGIKDAFAIAGVSFGLCGCMAFLFYNSFWGMCALPLVIWQTGVFWKREKRKRQKRRLEQEFKDDMYAVAGYLAAGYSIERAFIESLHDIRQLYGDASILAEKLAQMEARLGVQEPLEHILYDFATENVSGDIEGFVEVFCYAKRGGGDFIQIITTSIGRICDKMEVLEEIHTVMAEKALEQKVMCAVPLGILLFFRVSSPEFIGKLYNNLFGAVVMTVALLLYAAAFFLGIKIMEVEV